MSHQHVKTLYVKALRLLALSGAEFLNEALTFSVASSIDLTDADLPDVWEVDVTCLSFAVVKGRLHNSEMLSKLDDCFPHLSQYQQENVVSLIGSHASLFSDVPN